MLSGLNLVTLSAREGVVHRLLVAGLLWLALIGLGCARPVKVARPVEGVEYVVVRVPGMIPQARVERCTAEGCAEIFDVRQRTGVEP
jgi:hypothetical protein